MQQAEVMEKLIDKLCDHLPLERIKLFIENGFDEWETITFMKGQELVELGYNPQECIIIMVAVNSQAKQIGIPEIFTEQKLKLILELANRAEKQKHEQILKEQAQKKLQNLQIKKQQIKSQEIIKQFPQKQINQAILLKGVTLRGKQKVPLAKIILMSLQEKEITHICEMERVPQLQNLHLSHNHIYKIQNLDSLIKLRILKLQSNEIIKMQGFNKLQSLQQLFLSDNHISHFQGLTCNQKLHLININNQRSKNTMTFDQLSCQSLAYSLQTILCQNNRIKDITNFRHFKVVNSLHLRNNLLSQMETLSQPFGGMERLKNMDFRGNPLCSIPKYRDYMVILCKNLEQLDLKKILPKQRQYLVKLYSLKHSKQMRQQTHQNKKIPTKQSQLNIKKLEEGVGMYSHGSDLRGNVAYANTKVHRM